MPSDYRLAATIAARVTGLLALGAGVVLVALVVLAAVLGWPASALVGAAALVLAGVAVVAVVVRRPVVRLDDDGYELHRVRGAGVRAARWTDVEEATAVYVAGQRCVRVTLADGGMTMIPAGLLAGGPDAFADDLRAHLDAGHGYRRLDLGPPPG